MKNFYLITLSAITFFFLPACSFYRYGSYEERIANTWQLVKVDHYWRSGHQQPVFTGGQFTFFTSGRLEYIDEAGHLYKGSWNLRNVKKDTSLSRNLLFISLIDFSREEVKSVIFDNIIFTRDQGFRAYIYGGVDAFRLHFKKM